MSSYLKKLKQKSHFKATKRVSGPPLNPRNYTKQWTYLHQWRYRTRMIQNMWTFFIIYFEIFVLCTIYPRYIYDKVKWLSSIYYLLFSVPIPCHPKCGYSCQSISLCSGKSDALYQYLQEWCVTMFKIKCFKSMSCFYSTLFYTWCGCEYGPEMLLSHITDKLMAPTKGKRH